MPLPSIDGGNGEQGAEDTERCAARKTRKGRGAGVGSGAWGVGDTQCSRLC